MSFYGYRFIFDDIPSETYGLYISKIGGYSTDSASGGSDVEIVKQKIRRKPNYFIHGIEQSATLEFELSILSKDAIPRDVVSVIQKWLFGQMKYKKLRIVQEDMQNYYFNCFLKNPKVIAVGNIVYGFECSIECDSPWAWEFDATYQVGSVSTSKNFSYFNTSDNNDYTYPTYTFKKTGLGDVTIINTTDNNHTVSFTDILDGDVITIDNNLQIISSTLDDNLLSKSNLKWGRLVGGLNNIQITGDLEYFNITHKVARKVGS